MELIFTPKTDFWKKKIKSSNKQKYIENEKKNKQISPCFSLISNAHLQNEFINILKKFLESTNSYMSIKKKSSSNQNLFEIPVKNSLENQKFAILTRMKISLLICLVCSNPIEITNALEILSQSICNENEVLNDHLKKQLINSDAINIVFNLFPYFKNNTSLIILIADLLLNMSSNGEHYRNFITEISEESRSEVISIKKNILIKIFKVPYENFPRQ